jgi:adhesin transport system membrane fusion protein
MNNENEDKPNEPSGENRLSLSRAIAPISAAMTNAVRIIRAPNADNLPQIFPRSQYADFLPEIEAVAEREHSPLARVLIIALSSLFLAALAWAGFAEVDKVATAQAQVRPVGRVKVINHPDGGTVTALHVREGSVVKEGDILLELDPTLVRQELAKATNEWLTRSAELARLTSEITGKPLEFPADVIELRPDLVETQTRLFEERKSGLGSRRGAAGNVISQRQAEVAGLTEQLLKMQASLDVLREQEEATATLMDKGYFPKLRYLSIKRQVTEQEAQIAQIKAQLASARAGLHEASNKREGLDSDSNADMLDKLGTARRDRDVAYRTVEQHKARIEAMALRSPVDGVVQKLIINSAGQAVRPGEAVLNIIPTGDSLVVEANISNADIGYIQIGQRATVKIATYDHIKFGTLDGEVEQISADAVEDPKTHELTYPVIVRTKRTYLGDRPGVYQVQPGMLAEVDFKIGERTILSYLTDRVLHTTSNAFHER